MPVIATGRPPISSLSSETRPAVDTATAAYYLNRRPQTLRKWACHENGPIKPLRVYGRLAWSVSELKMCQRRLKTDTDFVVPAI